MTQALDHLVEVLDLEQIGPDTWRGVSAMEERIRLFGGLVASQALVAAGRSVPDDASGPRPVHSLHAYFLLPGDPSTPIDYEVDRIRDGRSFTDRRRVVARQHGEVIFHLSASFHSPESGVSHQSPMPAAPDPETLPTWSERMAPYADAMGAWYHQRRPIDVRYVGEPARTVPKTAVRPPYLQMWFRADGNLPDDPLLHACVITFASDLTLLDTVMLPHGLVWEGDSGRQVGLDHAVWFHKPVRADDWLFYEQHSPVAAGARGLGMGSIFTRDGDLVVSVVQEGLIRAALPTKV